MEEKLHIVILILIDEPYEINISLFDAMKETFSKEKKLFMEDIYAYTQL